MTASLDVAAAEKPRPEPKYVAIDRVQSFWASVDVEDLIPADHRARAIWELLGKLDFSAWEKNIDSREGLAGRACFSPRLLAGIWLYGYSIEIASARALARMMSWEPGLRWLTGCQEINPHTLSDFRVQEKEWLEGLFTNLVAVLRREGLVDLQVVTQDGTKVEAQAGKQSMHRRATIETELAEARQHIQKLDQRAREDEAQDERRAAAQKRVARERVERLESAMEEMQRRENETAASRRETLRVSTSEPEVRKMKHADGSWSPSHNVQVTTDAKEKVIVGVAVTTDANDVQQLLPAVAAMIERTGEKPGCVIADGGYVSRGNVEGMAEQGIELVAPVKESAAREAGAVAANRIDPEFGPSMFVWDEGSQSFVCPAGQRLEKVKLRKHHGQMCEVYGARAEQCGACEKAPRCCRHLKPGVPRKIERVRESSAMEELVKRMEQPDKQALYQKRSGIAETPHMRWKGNWKWRRFSVRGLRKAGMEALWLALAYNAHVWARVMWRPQLAAATA
jgi:transposase